MKVTEEEAINITIEHGYEGNELNTKVWKDRGCLMLNNRTQKGLVSKLETIFNNVSVEGVGKKRAYILENKKQELTVRKMNYKGTVPSSEDTLMKNYIHGQLIRLQIEMPLAYKSWGERLRLPQTKNIELQDCSKLIKSKYADYHLLYNPREIVGGFITEINMRNKAVIENSFRSLEKEKKISVQTIYQFVADEDSGEINQDLYDKIQDDLKEYIQSIGSNYMAYIQAISNPFKSKHMREITKQVDKYLKEKHGIHYIYKSFKIAVLNNMPDVVVSDDEFTQAHYKRFITLTEQRQNKDKYKNSLSVRQRFYLYNTLILLSKLGQQYDLYIRKVEKEMSDKIELYKMDLRKDEYNKLLEKHAFGELPRM